MTARTTRTTRRSEPRGRAAAARNVSKTALLALLLVGAAGGLGFALADTRGLTFFAFAALLATMAAWLFGDRVLLGSLGARVLAEAELVPVRLAVARLCAELDLPVPRLYLLADGFPRALALGRRPVGARLVVSQGLSIVLAPAQLAAVLAHELAHIRARDIAPHTAAALVGGTLLELSRVGWRLQRALLHVLAPVAAACAHLILSPEREFAADRLAASLAGPGALADALLRLDAAADSMPFAAPPATSCLYPVVLFDPTDRVARMFDTHPPLEQRVRALRELQRSDHAEAAPSGAASA